MNFALQNFKPTKYDAPKKQLTTLGDPWAPILCIISSYQEGLLHNNIREQLSVTILS